MVEEMNKYVDLYMQGMSMSEIADTLGCSRQNVHAHLQKEGIKLKPSFNKVVDHEGKEFASQNEMCEHWGVKLNTFQDRKRKGWSLEECLVGRKTCKKKIKNIKDHKGNKFINEREMCEHWVVKYATFRQRLNYGHTLEDALTGWVVDHVGNHYTSEEEMCEHWGVKFSTYQQRKYTYGYTLQECLEGRPRTRSKKNDVQVEEKE